MDRAQKRFLRMRIIVAEISRPLSGRGADDDEAEVGLTVGEAVHGEWSRLTDFFGEVRCAKAKGVTSHSSPRKETAGKSVSKA